MKIVLINGPLGVGKTEVANAVAERLDNSCVLEFDSLQNKYKPKTMADIFGQRYPSAKMYLIDGLICEIQKRKEAKKYNYLIVPIALINDVCKVKLIEGISDIEKYHFILTVEERILTERIMNQLGRDIDLAMTYMKPALDYLQQNYKEAIRIDTSYKSIDCIAKEIIDYFI